MKNRSASRLVSKDKSAKLAYELPSSKKANAALIVAAGRGARFNSIDNKIPKQYHKIGQLPILRLTIDKFLDNNNIDLVSVVIHPDDTNLYNEAIKGLESNKKLMEPIYGADFRKGSVFLGLQSLKYHNINKILIHDGVRPFVSQEAISQSIAKIKPGVATMVAKAIYNTVRKVSENKSTTIDRNNLYSVETPQGFMFEEILKAYKNSDHNFTDDISLIEKECKIEIIESNSQNNKITTIHDMPQNKKYRNSIGLGFDAHRFTYSDTNTFIRLGGVDIPFDKAILAHSDGDVILHALVDAIFGAIGAGDIGVHFPPSNDKWKNANSVLFVEYALNMIKEKQAIINNVDITLIGEKPRIGEYRASIQQKISELLEIETAQVNIKATTTETMGFTGREEGLAAQSIVSLCVPVN